MVFNNSVLKVIDDSIFEFLEHHLDSSIVEALGVLK